MDPNQYRNWTKSFTAYTDKNYSVSYSFNSEIVSFLTRSYVIIIANEHNVKMFSRIKVSNDITIRKVNLFIESHIKVKLKVYLIKFQLASRKILQVDLHQ